MSDLDNDSQPASVPQAPALLVQSLPLTITFCLQNILATVYIVVEVTVLKQNVIVLMPNITATKRNGLQLLSPKPRIR